MDVEVDVWLSAASEDVRICNGGHLKPFHTVVKPLPSVRTEGSELTTV